MTAEYLLLMLGCYALTVAIEAPVLLLLLSRRHGIGVRLFAGVWLTACTYPVVWLVLPPLFAGEPRWLYLAVAETFAPVAECAAFWFAFVRGRSHPIANEPDEPDWGDNEFERVPSKIGPTWRDCGAIVLANLCSFGAGEVLIAMGWLG